MQPILTIAIPTFNRPERVKHLYTEFLSKVASSFEEIEIVICDNSDEEQSLSNKFIINNSRINYIKNEFNLGYSGNVVRCLQKANGVFAWVISDDDDVDFNAFVELVPWLKRNELENLNAIMLPFYNFLENGDRYLDNTKDCWGGTSDQLSKNISISSKIPFILFSSVIVRIPLKRKQFLLDKVSEEFKGNDYIQVPLFTTLIGQQGRIGFFHSALQEYRPPKVIRFSLLSMVQSMDQALFFLIGFYNLPKDKFSKANYSRWMRWLLLHRLDKVEINGADEARWHLLLKWKLQHLSTSHAFLIAVLCVLPKSWSRMIYQLKNIKNGRHG